MTELIELSDRTVFKCGDNYYRIRFRARRPEKSLKVLPVVLLLENNNTQDSKDGIPEVDKKSEFLIFDIDPNFYGWFKHFKDRMYLAWGTATRSNDPTKKYVIYEQLYVGNGMAMSYRPIDNFTEEIIKDDNLVARFAQIKSFP